MCVVCGRFQTQGSDQKLITDTSCLICGEKLGHKVRKLSSYMVPIYFFELISLIVLYDKVKSIILLYQVNNALCRKVKEKYNGIVSCNFILSSISNNVAGYSSMLFR